MLICAKFLQSISNAPLENLTHPHDFPPPSPDFFFCYELSLHKNSHGPFKWTAYIKRAVLIKVNTLSSWKKRKYHSRIVRFLFYAQTQLDDGSSRNKFQYADHHPRKKRNELMEIRYNKRLGHSLCIYISCSNNTSHVYRYMVIWWPFLLLMSSIMSYILCDY